MKDPFEFDQLRRLHDLTEQLGRPSQIDELETQLRKLDSGIGEAARSIIGSQDSLGAAAQEAIRQAQAGIDGSTMPDLTELPEARLLGATPDYTVDAAYHLEAFRRAFERPIPNLEAELGTSDSHIELQHLLDQQVPGAWAIDAADLIGKIEPSAADLLSKPGLLEYFSSAAETAANWGRSEWTRQVELGQGLPNSVAVASLQRQAEQILRSDDWRSLDPVAILGSFPDLDFDSVFGNKESLEEFKNEALPLARKAVAESEAHGLEVVPILTSVYAVLTKREFSKEDIQMFLAVLSLLISAAGYFKDDPKVVVVERDVQHAQLKSGSTCSVLRSTALRSEPNHESTLLTMLGVDAQATIVRSEPKFIQIEVMENDHLLVGWVEREHLDVQDDA